MRRTVSPIAQEQRHSALRSDYYMRKYEREHLPPPDLYIATLEGVKTPEQELLERERYKTLDRYIDDLPPRKGLAIRLIYGIRCEPHTLEQAGDIFGVSRERIRQLVAEGERLLRYKILRKENPKRWHELRTAEQAKADAKQRQLNEEYAAARSAREAQEAREREAWEAAVRKAAAQLYARQQATRYDIEYQEAHALNDQWDSELKRRAFTAKYLGRDDYG